MKVLEQVNKTLKWSKSDKTIQFSTSVEVRPGNVRPLVSPLARNLENRSKDFGQTWSEVKEDVDKTLKWSKSDKTIQFSTSVEVRPLNVS